MSDVQLTAEEFKLFEDFYQNRLAEAGGARDLRDELAVAQDILASVVSNGLTPQADGSTSFVRRQGALDWGDPATVQAAAQASTPSGGGRKPRLGAGPATAGGKGGAKDTLLGVGMLVGALAIAIFFFGSKLPGGNAAKPKVTITPSAAVVESADATATPLPTLEAELLASIVDASGVKTGLVAPRTLEIKGVSFVVQPVKITAGDWPPPDDERAVSWVYGTIVNYVMGVESTPDNKTLLASLKAGDELLLRMSTGPAYRFAFADVVRIAPQASEIFRQTRPGLTLALLSEANDSSRIVVRAVYLPDSELSGGDAPAAQAIEEGQPVTLDGALRLSYLGATPFTTPRTPAGRIYLAVDYAVENVLASGETLLTTNFTHQAVDADGLAYPISSPVDGSTTRYLPLPAQLEPGRVVTTTSVYAVPETTLQTGLTWRFATSPSGTLVRARIEPYSGSLQPQVAVRGAKRLPDESLIVTLSLSAPALRDVQISAGDIQVQGGDLGTSNAFPWHVAAGQSTEFTLTLIPQDKSPMMVALLGQGFELSVEKQPMAN
jgi:hypothetical protein